MQEFMDLFIFHPSGWNMYNSLRTSNIGFIYLFFEVELILGESDSLSVSILWR